MENLIMTAVFFNFCTNSVFSVMQLLCCRNGFSAEFVPCFMDYLLITAMYYLYAVTNVLVVGAVKQADGSPCSKDSHWSEPNTCVVVEMLKLLLRDLCPDF